MRQRLFVVVCVVLLSLSGACSRGKPPEPRKSATFESSPVQSPGPGYRAESQALRVGAGEPVVGGSGAGVPGRIEREPIDRPIPVPQDRKLIYQGDATLGVASVDAALARLRELTQNAGGYVTSETRSRDYQRVNHGKIECRIPAGKLDSITAALKAIGTVESLTLSANDITEEYFDLEIQLRNQRALETRLIALLQRPTNKLSDLLEAERELARVRGEIDQMEGRRRFWDNRVSLSTLTVSVHEPVPTVGADRGGALSVLRDGFADAAENFVSAIAGIIAFAGGAAPIAVAVIVVAWIAARAWRWRRARRGGRPATTTIAPQQ